MSSIKLLVESDLFNCNLCFSRRISVLTGDSGSGKTTLVELFREPIEGVYTESTYPVVVCSMSSWKHDIETHTNSILILDDLGGVPESRDFSSLVKDFCIKNNLYFIIITRETLFKDYTENDIVGAKSYKDLYATVSYSVHSIYELKNNGNNYYIEEYYRISEASNSGYDLCITEDSKGGYTFFKELYKNKFDVIPTIGGKQEVVNFVEKYKDYSKILVVVDTSSYGPHIQKLYKIASTLSCKVVILWDLESFEELLLKTNMLKNLPIVKDAFSNLEREANSYICWEKYFEFLIYEATRNEMFKYSHKNKGLKDCYTKPCCSSNSYIEEKCSCKDRSKNKFEYLLKGTKYEYLLQINEC